MATEEDNEPYKWYCRHEPYQLLITAMQIRNIQWISYLIRSGKVDPNLWDGTEPLLFVFIDSSFSLSQKKELIRLAVAHGADVNARNINGFTPLHLASAANIIRLLLKAGANPNAATASGITPLCLVHTWEQARLLIEAGANVHGNTFTTPLHHARTVENCALSDLARSGCQYAGPVRSNTDLYNAFCGFAVSADTGSRSRLERSSGENAAVLRSRSDGGETAVGAWCGC